VKKEGAGMIATKKLFELLRLRPKGEIAAFSNTERW
jgi:hypothetical protein